MGVEVSGGCGECTEAGKETNCNSSLFSVSCFHMGLNMGMPQYY